VAAATALTVEQAGERYLALVDAKNAAVAGASNGFETAQLEGDLTEAAEAMRELGRANDDFADGLSAEQWPTAVDTEVAGVIDGARAEAEAADAYAESILGFDQGSATAAETEAAATRLFEATSTTLDAAGPLRGALGLPPVPNG
jgi:hypothetical protein